MAVELQRAPLAPAAPEADRLQSSLRVLFDHRILVAAVAGGALLAGLAYAQLATPLFHSDALLQIEEKKKGIAGLEELNALNPADNAADPEIEVLRSRAMAGEVVKKLSLEVEAAPRHFPVIGAAQARAWRGPGIAAGPPWLSRFAWGGESIRVERLAVPPELEGRPLLLTAEDDGRFKLAEAGRELLAGRVGAPAEGGGVAVFVSQLVARRGTGFVLTRLPWSDAVERLQASLAISERGSKTGIVTLALSGEDPRRVAAILGELQDAYVRQNVERKSEEAQRTLTFVDAQLPEIKARLEAAEEALNSYRTRNRRVDVPMETKAAIDRTVELEKAALDLRMQRTELSQRFTESHPLVVAARRKLAQLDAQRAAVESRLRGLPKAELTSMRLLRDVKLASELYVLLLNKAQELRVVRSGTIGNVRVLDRPLVARVPVQPRKGQIAVLSLVLGLLLGVFAALGRHALGQGVEDPNVLEAATGLGVYAHIPHTLRAAAGKGPAAPLVRRLPADLASEAFRSLRTSLHFALIEAPRRSVAICGPSPGTGKSFVAANLAQVVADSGKSVLLVDGDMRNGSLHAAFGFPREGGLSEMIAGTVSPERAIRRAGPCLDVLTAGVVPPNPSELLASARFRSLLDAATGRYDLVILDTPPTLAVTDGALIARLAGVTLLVLRSGHHPLREIQQAIKQLALGGVRAAGFVFNDVPRSKPGFYGYQVQYEYLPGRAS